MPNVLISSNQHAGLGRLLPAAVAALLIAGGALAQEPTPGQKDPQEGNADKPRVLATTQPARPIQTRVVRLAHASATEIAAVLGNGRRGIGTCNIVPDQRTNSLIIAATEAEFPELMKLVENLDHQSPDNTPSIQTYLLQNRPVDNELRDLLAMLLGNRCVAVDKYRRLVIISGDKEIQKMAAGLLQEIDAPIPEVQPPPKISRIRIAWLATGPEARLKGLPEVPHTLKDAAEEISRILGSAAPRLVAQCMVDTSGGDNFELNTSVSGPTGAECILNITGRTSFEYGKPILDLKIAASGMYPTPSPPRSPKPAGPDLAIKTIIAAEPEQDVVLGVSPTGDMASAFVVRILK